VAGVREIERFHYCATRTDGFNRPRPHCSYPRSEGEWEIHSSEMGGSPGRCSFARGNHGSLLSLGVLLGKIGLIVPNWFSYFF
jgi:hypothetical protein